MKAVPYAEDTVCMEFEPRACENTGKTSDRLKPNYLSNFTIDVG